MYKWIDSQKIPGGWFIGSFVLKVCNILLRELWDKGIDMFTIWLKFPEYGSNVGKRNKHAKTLSLYICEILWTFKDIINLNLFPSLMKRY